MSEKAQLVSGGAAFVTAGGILLSQKPVLPLSLLAMALILVGLALVVAAVVSRPDLHPRHLRERMSNVVYGIEADVLGPADNFAAFQKYRPEVKAVANALEEGGFDAPEMRARAHAALTLEDVEKVKEAIYARRRGVDESLRRWRWWRVPRRVRMREWQTDADSIFGVDDTLHRIECAQPVDLPRPVPAGAVIWRHAGVRLCDHCQPRVIPVRRLILRRFL